MMAELLYPTRKPRSSGRGAVTATTTTAAPEINSVGPPHAIHADRIIGLMLQQMAQRNAQLWAAIHAVTKDPHVCDGNPRAQVKLEAKIKKLGALLTILKPGKRGRYELLIHSLAGWDPQRDALIEPGDPVPDKPWICTLIHVICGEGHGRVRYETLAPVLFLTHHCLSRTAQRWGVRTVSDLSAAIEEITTVVFNYLSIAPPDHLVRSPRTNLGGLGATPGSTPGSTPRPKACACRCQGASR
jgi:hypothetical protein